MTFSYNNQNNQSTLLCNLNSQRLDGQFCDVQLKIGKLDFSIHSCVLAAYNPTILDNHNINDCSFVDPLKLSVPVNYKNEDLVSENCDECASSVIEFMYLGNIQIQSDHVIHIVPLGNFLGLIHLATACKDYLEKSINDLVNPNTPCLDICDSLGVDSDGNVDHEELLEYIEESAEPNNTDVVSSVEDLSTSLKHFSCSKCEETFSDPILLRRHRETHLSKLYSCYTCEYSSQKAFQLIKHLIDAKHNEKVCSLCMHESENPEKLRGHLEQHNHPKPFFCRTCKLRFPTRAGLNSHLPRHSSDTPFRCSVCLRGFKWKHNLQSHLVIHTAEKKHLCELCGFSTAHKNSFSAHELSHTGYSFKCQITGCKFVTTSKRSVGAHLATHSKEKSYQCEICGQSFSQSKNLRRHAIKHDSTVNGDLCPLCTFKTIRSDKLQEHFRRQHPESDISLLPLKKKIIIDSPLTQGGSLVSLENVEIIASFFLEEAVILPVENIVTDENNK